MSKVYLKDHQASLSQESTNSILASRACLSEIGLPYTPHSQIFYFFMLKSANRIVRTRNLRPYTGFPYLLEIIPYVCQLTETNEANCGRFRAVGGHFEAAGTTQRTPGILPSVWGPALLPIRLRKVGGRQQNTLTQILKKNTRRLIRASKEQIKPDKMSLHNLPCRELGRKLVLPN